MSDSFEGVAVGDRIQLVRALANESNSAIPVEDVPVGTLGTVDWVSRNGQQLGVKWDNGSRVSLLADDDDGRWEVVRP